MNNNRWPARSTVLIDRELINMAKFIAGTGSTVAAVINEELRNAIVPKYIAAVTSERDRLVESISDNR